MRKNTNGHGLFGSVLVTLLAVGWILLMLACVLSLFFSGVNVELAAIAVVGIYVLGGLAVAFGLCFCLYQRWQEVKGGEEDEARKY